MKPTVKSEAFPSQNLLKQGGTLLPLLSNFATEYAIRNIEENQERLHLLVFADNVNLLGKNIIP
jgi:hypothetical protein